MLARGISMEYAAIITLAAIVSFDGLTAGFAYGMRKITLAPLAIGLVSLTSALTMLISMSVGSVIRSNTSPLVAKALGSILLAGLGIYILLQSRKCAGAPEPAADRQLLNWRIRPLGLVIQVWRDPVRADRDSSGAINFTEAVVLGAALAMDAFAAGLGAAMTGLPPVPTALTIGVCKFIFVSSGLGLGHRLAGVVPPNWFSPVPGALLIILGVWRFF
jgi:putative sporulation protein YtaF